MGRTALALLDTALGLLCLSGVWIALPNRWWVVDAWGTTLALLFFALAVGTAWSQPGARLLARISGGLLFVGGAALVTTVALTAAHLSAVFGSVGTGGLMLFGSVALLLLPYLVVYPAWRLWLLRSE